MSQEEGDDSEAGKASEGESPPEEPPRASAPRAPQRKEESPFSFKHFLKRDLSLPTTSYESTGARPKVYQEQRVRDQQPQQVQQQQQEAPSLSFRRSHTSNDALGMPSLPDFVQDHLLMEQAYLGSDGPLTVDLDNLPDFALNSGGGGYDDGASGGGACRSDEPRVRCRPSPLDLPNNLNLDLTESLNDAPQHREGNAARRPCPLDLTGVDNTLGNEPLRLPDFLPAQAGSGGACSMGVNDGSRDEVAEERRLRLAAERELRAALQTTTNLRRELQTARNSEQNARRELLEARTASTRFARELRGAGRAHAGASTSTGTASTSQSPPNPEDEDHSAARQNTGDDVSKLKTQISQLRDELSIAHREIDELRSSQRSASRSLRLATNTAEGSLRELLVGLEQLRGLASSMDPP